MKTPTGYKYQNFVYNIEYVPKRYLIKIHQLKIKNMHSESLHRQFKMSRAQDRKYKSCIDNKYINLLQEENIIKNL